MPTKDGPGRWLCRATAGTAQVMLQSNLVNVDLETFYGRENQSGLSPESRAFINSPNNRVRARGTASRATNSPVTINEASSVSIITSSRDLYQLIAWPAVHPGATTGDRLDVVSESRFVGQTLSSAACSCLSG